MTQFQLKQVSANDSLIKFHVINQSDGSICGSINVEPSEESDLLAHWRDASRPAAAAAKGTAAALVAKSFRAQRHRDAAGAGVQRRGGMTAAILRAAGC